MKTEIQITISNQQFSREFSGCLRDGAVGEKDCEAIAMSMFRALVANGNWSLPVVMGEPAGHGMWKNVQPISGR